jgi:hypothetical protein
VAKSTFRPGANGFAFSNSWTLDEVERAEMRRILRTAVDSAMVMLSPIFGGALSLFGVGAKLAEWAAGSFPDSYGLCGGMAFGASDYYRSNMALPAGKGPSDQPTRTTPGGAALRAYLWKRLIDSLIINAPTYLAWMAVLHLIPREFPFFGGHPWLRDRSREHWQILRGHIDTGQPWPIGLIGSNKDPFSNHVVLAYGYDDAGDGTGTIYIYDPNCPGATEHTITVDFRSGMLLTSESCGNRTGWTPIRGFFCNGYTPLPPPTLDHTDLLLYDRTSRQAEIHSTDGQGNISLLLQHNGWRSSWTHMLAGQFLNGATGILLYDAAGREVEVYRVDAQGHLLIIRRLQGWRDSWSRMTTGYFGGNGNLDLLLYDAGAGHAEFYATDGQGNISLLKGYTDWRQSWTHIIPGQFGGDGYTDLLLYDAGAGHAEFYATDGQGNISLLKGYTDWRQSWTHIVPGQFGGDGYTDLLLYDAGAGHAEFYATDGQGNISLLKGYTDWRQSWTHIVPGFFRQTLPW